MIRRGKGIRDLRAYARSTQARLLAGAILILFLVGGSLIYFFYGPGGAMLGVLCLVAGLSPALLIVLGLWLIDRFVRARRDL